MSKLTTKAAELYIVDNSTETKIANITDFSLDVAASTIDFSTLSTEWSDQGTGIKSGSGSFTALVDPTDTVLNTLETAMFGGTELSLAWYPQGKTAGKPKITFNAFLTAYNTSAAVNAALSIAISYVVDGAVTSGTVSA